MRDPVAEFTRFNEPFLARSPDLIRAKIARMVHGPFPFFRGTFHLFARDVIDETFGPLGDTGAQLPLVGDIHAENYGTFKGEDGYIHYDINDFDETTKGRLGLDIGRLAASFFLAGRERGDPLERAVHTTLAGIQSYAEALAKLIGKGRKGEPKARQGKPSGCPVVDELIQAAAAPGGRAGFIGKLTERGEGKPQLLRSSKHYTLPASQAEQVRRLVADYRGRCGFEEPDEFWEIYDVAGRVSGIGSMGRLRFIALLAGRAGKGLLLEFKESLPSAYDVCRGKDGDLADRASRVAAVMRRAQVVPVKYLGWALDGGQSFQVRQLSAHNRRVETIGIKPGSLESVARLQGAILARVHARLATGDVGPMEPVPELADAPLFIQRVLAFALACADQACRDWAAFKAASATLVP
jgi:uncharacterized protein (DUF2252 family)